MGTIVKPCDDYLHMLEIRKLLESKIKALHNPCIPSMWSPLSILSVLNHKLFCRVIYNAVCYSIAERNQKNISSKYLVADISVIDALCMHLTEECPGFETPRYLYKVNILGTVLEVIQDIPRPNKDKYNFLIL